jgi:hypothetical protein
MICRFRQSQSAKPTNEQMPEPFTNSNATLSSDFWALRISFVQDNLQGNASPDNIAGQLPSLA